jgi:hypothetical protein
MISIICGVDDLLGGTIQALCMAKESVAVDKSMAKCLLVCVCLNLFYDAQYKDTTEAIMICFAYLEQGIILRHYGMRSCTMWPYFPLGLLRRLCGLPSAVCGINKEVQKNSFRNTLFLFLDQQENFKSFRTAWFCPLQIRCGPGQRLGFLLSVANVHSVCPSFLWDSDLK